MGQEQIHKSSNSKTSEVRQKQRAQANQQAEAHDNEHVAQAAEKGEELKEELDEVLDDIDKNLQEDAELESERKRAEGYDLMRRATAEQLGGAVIASVDHDVLFQFETGYRPGSNFQF